MFKLNESLIDRALRVILGAAVLSFAFVGPQTPLGYLGLILIVTGIIGWCPIYMALGLSTSHKKNNE
ncbi:YgaP family membrane protein [Hirschia maritima]|uniref:YgaP family membrane protein n=1 Tax=Hirschia maritima TaxID=1121961 RepID=UPI0003A8A311|nr:DUF2892 domain-containing protein [Hirschia maritima]